MLYGYGLRLGVELLLRGKYRAAIRYLVIPVNYWRALEYRLVYEEGDFHEGETVLDIGSPKLLSLYLAERNGCQGLLHRYRRLLPERVRNDPRPAGDS